MKPIVIPVMVQRLVQVMICIFVQIQILQIQVILTFHIHSMDLKTSLVLTTPFWLVLTTLKQKKLKFMDWTSKLEKFFKLSFNYTLYPIVLYILQNLL
jgi:hypothetical protein